MSAKTRTKILAKPEPEALSCFRADCSGQPNFRYQRYFWKESGPRTGIAATVRAKLQPAGHQAARHDLLLPPTSPGEYSDLDHLLARFDATQPSIERNGFAQFTIDLSSDLPLHASWEDIRAWVRSYFVSRLQLAALMVLHAPFMAGSANDPHVHILLPARRLSANGFGLHARDVCCDEGHAEAQRDWNAFRAAGHSNA